MNPELYGDLWTRTYIGRLSSRGIVLNGRPGQANVIQVNFQPIDQSGYVYALYLLPWQVEAAAEGARRSGRSKSRKRRTRAS